MASQPPQRSRSAWAGREARGGRVRGKNLSGEDYWRLSARPLHTLALLLPLIVLYEFGSLAYLTDQRSGTQQSIRAEKLLHGFFEMFGVLGLIAPGLVIIVVLLAWHIVSRDAWRLRALVVVGMALEAVLWCVPLLVFGALFQRATLGEWGGGPSAAAAGTLVDLSRQAKLTIAIGAGLYEELLFRFLAIAALHLVMRDLLKAGESTARVVAVLGSALAFAFYHDQVFAAASSEGATLLNINLPSLAFYCVAGLYFAGLYLARGFGIVAGAHAAYDVFVLVVLAGG